jgi:4-hydroxy-2-oxoheptanedioate aldolase
MRANTVRDRLGDHQLVTTGWVASGNAYVAETLGHCGYDAVTVDLQHGMFGVDAAVACLQAISATPAVPLARVPSLEAAVIGKMLDAGAYGVICPAIDTAADATELVAACRYPPRGRRSFGPARGLLYGGADYAEQADDVVLAVGMIESTTALEHLDEILAVDGLDAVYVGPNDLAVSAGWSRLGDAEATGPLGDAIAHVAERAGQAGVAAGIFAPFAGHLAQFVRWGYRLIAPGNDIALMRAEAVRRLGILRDA